MATNDRAAADFLAALDDTELEIVDYLRSLDDDAYTELIAEARSDDTDKPRAKTSGINKGRASYQDRYGRKDTK